MATNRVVIIGGKGTAINIAEQIDHAHRRHQSPLIVEGFAIDDKSLGNSIAGFPVVCEVHEAWLKYKDTSVGFIFALYRPDTMEHRVNMLRQLGIPTERFMNFVHPTAYVSSSAEIGYGNVILSHATLQHKTRLGNNNIVNSNVIVEHESTLNNSTFIASGACIGARVVVGDGVFIGLSAVLREDVEVGDFAFVGMSAVVLENVAARTLIYGAPAKRKS